MADSDVSASSTARVLVMVEQPLIADVIKLTLNHGVYETRDAGASWSAIRRTSPACSPSPASIRRAAR